MSNRLSEHKAGSSSFILNNRRWKEISLTILEWTFKMVSTTLATSVSAALSIATVPTCFVISVPQQIDSWTFSSGEYDIFAHTTYTALSSETFTFAATTDVTCVQPGQTIPNAIIPGLTPKIATASTCVVVSQPQEINTITYSSGHTGLSPHTTYTALTVTTFTNTATTIASCFKRGETIPALTVPTTMEGIKCSTTTYPESTLVQTYAPGVSGIFSKTTRTATETSTSIVPAHTYIDCDVLPDYQNPETCHTIKPLAWALLVITFVTIQLTWWIFDTPLLWKKGGGLRAFLDSISWACLRAHAAGSAGLISARLGSDSSQFARIYYLGMQRQSTPPEWKMWKLWTCIGTDLLTVATTIITLYEACTLPQADARRHFGVELWVYPSLPVALIGLSLLFGERFFPRTHKGNQLLLLFIVTLLLLVELAVTLVLWRFDTTDGFGTWWISIIFYSVMILPLVYDPRFHIFPCIAGWFARVGGVGFAALQHYAGGEPYCKISGKAFAIVYMTLGGIAAVLAFFGGVYHIRRKV
ncbi:uncharacterized protein PAC_19549 [Phialocephala subalpina]|uniref:Uncharacterized protein n=1 Tax=Phialocephala subalpina TaxID=576137 RepID=A0A1L7XXD4_9HELO|nr:uncharacterized protein PAC_19549 [Phialocephala subalpina]